MNFQVLIFHVENHPKYPYYTQCVTFNSFIHSKPEYDLLYRIFGMIMMYALPFVLLIILHSSIAIQLYKISHSAPGTFGIPGEVTVIKLFTKKRRVAEQYVSDFIL